VNFAHDLVDRRAPDGLALVELARDGARRELTFGEVSDRAARLAGSLERHGVRRGDVVMTLIGNRPEWVLTMVACFRIGAVVLPCTEQLRAKDLRLRVELARPAVIVADERNRDELQAALAADRDPGTPSDRISPCSTFPTRSCSPRSPRRPWSCATRTQP
jgi:acyl-coenzyme A synthetase/AMP-(fatty) acid ligase